MSIDPRLPALPDIHGHAKGEHKAFADERPIPYSARLIFLWFYHAAKRGFPRFMMVTDHVNYLTFEDPAAVNLVRRALRLALAGDLYGTAETAGVDIIQATTVSEALRAGMRFTIGAEVDNDPRSRPDAPNVVDAMRPDGIVRSIHFLPLNLPNQAEEFFWPFDNPEFAHFYDTVGVEETWERYIELLADAIATQPTHILGHLYVPGKFGHWPEAKKLEAYEDRILDICQERNIAIELNSRVFYRSNDEALKAKHVEVYSRLMRKAKERDVGIALGSDAHSPKDQGRSFDILLQMLDAADINEIVFPINGQHARVALRADRAKRAAAARAQTARLAAEAAALAKREADEAAQAIAAEAQAQQAEIDAVNVPVAIEADASEATIQPAEAVPQVEVLTAPEAPAAPSEESLPEPVIAPTPAPEQIEAEHIPVIEAIADDTITEAGTGSDPDAPSTAAPKAKKPPAAKAKKAATPSEDGAEPSADAATKPKTTKSRAKPKPTSTESAD